VSLHEDGVSAVCAAVAPGLRPRILKWGFKGLEQGQSPDKALASLARDFDLKRAHCTTVLNDGDYKLLLTEAPNVPSDELKAALRWRIKDLIDFHINDAALDAFDLPGIEHQGPRETYVVAARNAAIRTRADVLSAAGINLDIIDIPELAQRNIAACLPEDAAGMAMISFRPRNGLITVTRQGQLYLSRPLPVGSTALAEEGTRQTHFDQVVLEIQRSLDYFESHFREAPVRHVVVAPLSTEVPGLVDYLAANLSAQVSMMDLGHALDCEVEFPPAWQSRCLFTIGAALRQEHQAL
jgi:MSHA biogenesis protein MshI